MRARPGYCAVGGGAELVITIGFVSLGYAMYMRYLVIEQPSVVACDAGLNTWLCLSRRVAVAARK
jgi:hypothetical protein